MSKPNSKAICVLGMHRSGTSVITKAISKLGAYVGEEDELVPPLNDNPEGFWEYIEFVNIQERIFESFGLSWETLRPLPTGWIKSPIILFFREKLKRIIAEKFANKPIWAWKDPRTCLLLPLWQEILKELGIEITYVIAFRNPLDVIASLEKRDGFNRAVCEEIWYNYTLSSLYDLLDQIDSSKVFVQYDQFLNDPLLIMREIHNRLKFKDPFDVSEQDIIGLVKSNLRHSYNTLESLEQSKCISSKSIELYQICLQGVLDPNVLLDGIIRKKIKELHESFNSSSSYESISRQKLQIFWGNETSDFKEVNSLALPVVVDRLFHEYQFDLPGNSPIAIRIDPVTAYCYFEIRSLILFGIDQDDKLISIYQSSDDGFNSLRLVNGRVLSTTNTYIAISIDDPQIYYSNNVNLEEFPKGYKVKIEMCVNRELFPYVGELLYQTLTQYTEQLSSTSNLLVEAEKVLEQTQKNLEQKQTDLVQKQNDLEQIQIENNNLIGEVKLCGSKIEGLEKKNMDLIVELSNLQELNASLHVQLSNESMRLNQLLNSRSWKLTKPIRKLLNRKN